jgi:antitoxin component YwqK of YwqJK toxin-antitoxin module
MNGQLYYKGNYKSNKKEGVWFSYNIDGTVFKPWTGTFKDGKKIRD